MIRDETAREIATYRSTREDAPASQMIREAVRGTEVHTIHAEVEGRSKLPLFERILDDWIAGGVAFTPMEALARETLAKREDVPIRELSRMRLPGRAGEVATGWMPADLPK